MPPGWVGDALLRNEHGKKIVSFGEEAWIN
jgi:hypothetical protein